MKNDRGTNGGSPDFSEWMASPGFVELPASSLPTRPRPHRDPVYGSARLATVDDLGQFLERPDAVQPFAFEDVSLLTVNAAGRFAPIYRRPLYLSAAVRCQNALVVSKIGGGKTTKFLLPSFFADLADPNASAVFVDLKGDIEPQAAAVMGLTRPGQRPVVINFSVPNRTTHAVNLVSNGSTADLFKDCRFFCAAAEGDQRDESPFWKKTATRFLAGALLALRAEYGRASLADAHHLFEGPRDQLLTLLDRHPVRYAGGTASFLRSGSQNADTAQATLAGYLEDLVSDSLAAVTSTDEFRFGSLFRKPTVLILEVSQSDADWLRPYLNLFITRLFRSVTRYAEEQPAGRLPRPLGIYLDDLPALGRLPGLETYLNTLRSRDVRVTAAVQTLAQLGHWYGAAADEVLAGFGTKIFQPHLEQFDAEWVSRHVGAMTVLDRTAGDGGAVLSGRRGRAVPRPVLTPDEVRLSPANWFYDDARAATVFLPNTPPVQGWFQPCYSNPRYRGPVATAAARARAARLRKKPLGYTPPALLRSAAPFALTDTTEWTAERMLTTARETARKSLDWDAAPPDARLQWVEFERVNGDRPALVLRMVEELKGRKVTLAEFFEAHKESRTDNLQAILHFIDYRRLKKEAEHNKPG